MAHANRFVSELDRLRALWDERATRDPLAASQPGSGRTHEEFFASGERQVEAWSPELGSATGNAGGSVLDYGCGAGRLLPALSERFARVWGADVSPVMLDRARTLLPAGCPARLVLVDGMTLQGVRRERFDLVLAVDVLTHVPDPGLAPYLLRQFARRLAPGGRVLVELPPALAGETTFRHTGLTIQRLVEGTTCWVWGRGAEAYGGAPP